MARGSRHEDFAGISYETAMDLAQRGIDAPSADQMIRQRMPDKVLNMSDDDLADEVDIVCITDLKPWTHERPLDKGEQAKVPRKIAELLLGNAHAVIIRT